MLDHVKIEKVLFLDIETVPQYATYDELPERLKEFWDHKAPRIKVNDTDTPEILYERAGIYSEFGKIICISVGFIHNNKLRIKSFSGHDEAQLLREFAAMLENNFNKPGTLLCAHNGKEFDFPYIARRMLIHGIKLPFLLDIAGKKPWKSLIWIPWNYGNLAITKTTLRWLCLPPFLTFPHQKTTSTAARWVSITGLGKNFRALQSTAKKM